MIKKETKTLRFDEDAFDMDKVKRTMSNVAKIKLRNRRLRLIINVGKFVMMLGGFGLFLLLFYLAMEIIALF